MLVKVTTAGALTHSMPSGSDVIEGQDLTVQRLIDALAVKYGPELSKELLDQGRVRKGLCMLVNGRNVLSFPERFETPLEDGDEVLIALVVGGG